MKRSLLLQAAILLLSGCVSIALAQAGSGGSGGAGGHGGGQSGAASNATTGNAGGGGANTNAAAPDSNMPAGVQGNASQKTDASGTHPIGTPQSDVAGGTGKDHARSMTGCIVKEETDYFLVPKNGNGRRIQLQAGSTDLSQHVNHEVKVHGTFENGNNAATVGTTGTEANTGTNTATTSKHGHGGNRMMVVDRVDMVSETCPANTGTGTGTGTTTPPPQF